jgi:hypothetical protein
VNPESQEPPDGDFVAYLEAIERRQLAALRLQHTLPSPGATMAGGVQEPNAEQPALSRAEAEAQRRRLQQPTTSRSAAHAALPAAIVVALIVGAVLLFSGLFSDGGPFLFVIGVALLVYGVRRLLQFRRGVPDRARSQAMERISSLLDAARKR